MGQLKMPSLGADMEAGKLVEWLVKPGDTVTRGDVVAVVETQKGAIEIECFETGRVAELSAELGATLPVGAPLAVIVGEDEATPEAAPAPEPPPAPQDLAAHAAPIPSAPPVERRVAAPTGAVPPASPAARVLAHELGIDLAGIRGTGPGGVIVLGDVESGNRGSPSPSAPRSSVSPMEAMRQAIAAAMIRSKQTIPHFYVSETVDAKPALDFLSETNADRAPERRLLLGALLVRAMTLASARVSTVNGHFTEGAFSPAEVINPAIVIALRGGGLVAPALLDAETLDLDETMAGMRDLVTRARTGRLRSSEIGGGTITLSSLGETGAEAMTGIIFPPQVALVAVGAPVVRPWIVDGAVVPRPVLKVTLSVDHRVCDGRQAARFIETFKTALEDPETL